MPERSNYEVSKQSIQDIIDIKNEWSRMVQLGTGSTLNDAQRNLDEARRAKKGNTVVSGSSPDK